MSQCKSTLQLNNQILYCLSEEGHIGDHQFQICSGDLDPLLTKGRLKDHRHAATLVDTVKRLCDELELIGSSGCHHCSAGALAALEEVGMRTPNNIGSETEILTKVRNAFFEGVRYGRAADTDTFWEEVHDEEEAWQKYSAQLRQ